MDKFILQAKILPARCRKVAVTGFLLLSAQELLAGSPTNIFDPAATPARSIFGLSMLVLSVTLAIFLIVGGLLLYALIRFRHRSSDSEDEPAQIYGSNQIELSWTVIPILIVVMLFLSTTRVIWQTEAAPKPSSAVDVIVIGHQFWWEYRYPKLGVVTANELHIPISNPQKPSPAFLEMSSADVAHSFWIPRLAGKTDLIPNRVNTMWMDPPEAGLYLGQCAQYCGTQHAKMLLRVYAESPENFAAWIKQQQQPAHGDLSGNSLAEEGRAIQPERLRAMQRLPVGAPASRRQSGTRAGSKAAIGWAMDGGMCRMERNHCTSREMVSWPR